MLFLTFAGYRAFSKYCSDLTEQAGSTGYAIFLLVTGLFACLFFFCFNGFQITATVPTLLYALAYAVVAMICSVYTLKAFLYADVASVAVITSACGLIATSGIGALLFYETMDFIKVLRIVLMLGAIFLVFADVRRQGTEAAAEKRRKGIHFFFILLMLIAGNCASVIVLKYYSFASGVADENSLFFFTNVFIVLGVLLWLLFHLIRTPQKLKSSVSSFSVKSLFPIAAATGFSNLNSLVSIRLISQMDVSLYTPVSSAMEIASGVIVSFLFREKMGLFSAIALILSVISVVI